MYCAKCGTQSSQDDDFCRKCGASLNRMTPAPAPMPTAQTKIEVKETMTMYCSKCGAQNADGSQFCNKCGATIGQSTPQPTASQQSNNDALKIQIDEAKSSERTGWIMVAVGFIIIAIGAIVGLNSTALRYIGNLQYEAYHPNAEIGAIIVVGGGIIAFIGAIGIGFYRNKRLQLMKRLE